MESSCRVQNIPKNKVFHFSVNVKNTINQEFKWFCVDKGIRMEKTIP